jgi:hypothetical protein
MRDGTSITAEAIIVELMQEKTLDPSDQRLRSDLIKRTLRALDALRRLGKVEKIGKGRGVRWKIVDFDAAAPTGDR